MIFGIGTDLCAVGRMARMLERYGARAAQRILAASEQVEFDLALRPERFLARRFAAKEAFSKAFGTGLRAPVTLRNIAVGHDGLGKPVLVFAPALAEVLRQSALRAHLSISDEDEFALAYVVLEHDTMEKARD